MNVRFIAILLVSVRVNVGVEIIVITINMVNLKLLSVIVTEKMSEVIEIACMSTDHPDHQ